MPNISEYARVICPYFLRFDESLRALSCEGLLPGADMKSCFGKKREMLAWMRGACETYAYAERCPLAKRNEGKYGEAYAPDHAAGSHPPGV
jgi:hypothetical protein